jgi:TfoX/Sxy family transcriptional regulator of competence genes
MKWRKSPPKLVNLFQNVMPGKPAVQRKMFGYPAGFVNGNMFMGVFQEEMILRLSEQDREELLKVNSARIFEPMPGHPMREYVAVPPAMLGNRKVLLSWVSRALHYGSSLKPKPKSVKKKSRS